MPLWAQLADELRRGAAEGVFADRFPTELELTETYAVSRNTVREALRRLRDEGLVERQRGRGTTLNAAQIEQPLVGMYSLARTISEQGFNEHSEVVERELRSAGDAAEALDLDPSDEVIYLERVRFAGPEPIAIDRSWLPGRFAASLLAADLTRGSLYDELCEGHGIRIDAGSERIGPCVPDRPDRSTLRTPRGSAALRVERLVSSGGRPVERRISIIRGDRYVLVARWA